MKNTWNRVLPIMLIGLLLCGCGGEKKEEASSGAVEKLPSVTQSEETTAEEQTQQEEVVAPSEIEFDELTVVDNEECLLKITGIDPSNIWGYSLKALLENKSSDKTYMFAVMSAAINGVESDPLFATEVAPGKKSNETISFSDSSLQEKGVGEITDIEIEYRVYDTDDWMADPVAQDVFHVFPLGEDKATKYKREAQSTDVVLADNEHVSVILIGTEEDPIWGYTLNLYIENKTDRKVMVSVEDVSVNGFMADPLFAREVGAKRSAFTNISWMDSAFEENGIDTVESIEMTMHAYDSENYGDDYFKDTITLDF